MKTLEEYKAAHEAAEKRAEVAEKSAKDAEIAQKALQASVDTLTTELDSTKSLLASANEKIAKVEEAEKAAQDALIVRDVYALVGVKILPAERDAQLELARSNRSLFDKLMAQRPELKMLGASPITPEPSHENSAAAEPTGDDLASAVSELATH